MDNGEKRVRELAAQWLAERSSDRASPEEERLARDLERVLNDPAASIWLLCNALLKYRRAFSRQTPAS